MTAGLCQKPARKQATLVAVNYRDIGAWLANAPALLD